MLLKPQSKITLSELESWVDSDQKFSLEKSSMERVRKCQQWIVEKSQSERPLYGVNTGFGRLAQVKISSHELREVQLNLLRSHACGIGRPVSSRVARRLLFLRILSLGKGYSGISPEILQRHIDYVNLSLNPYVPEKGSVGASGDLAPLAELGLTFIGEGGFLGARGEKKNARAILKQHNWSKIELGPKEGLALTNGTQFSLSLGIEAWAQLQKLLPWMEAASCLSIEAHQATSQVYLQKIHELKKHRGQLDVARSLSQKLRKSKHIKSHRSCDRVQDSYSFRCIPQIVGPSLQWLRQAEFMLQDEANSVSDNPVIFFEEDRIYSCGHFHAQSVAQACDVMAMVVASFANLTERRIDQLINPLTARSPAFLANRPGVESGLMIVQTAAAALVNEIKTLASPASIDSIPTNGNQEDIVSMAPWAAQKLLKMIDNLRYLVAGELICAVRGCVLESTRTGLEFSPFVEEKLKELSGIAPDIFKAGDRVFSKDWEKLQAFLKL